MSMVRIRFTRDAREQRVEPGNPGDRDQTKRKDRNYEIVHKAGDEMDVKESSATHWIARGVAEKVGEFEPVSLGTLPPVGGMTLPRPPGV